MTKTCIICKKQFVTGDFTRSFHKFPTNSEQKQKWMEVIGTQEITHVSTICSDHFEEKSFYQSDGRIKIRRLVPTAVPTLHKNNSVIKQVITSTSSVYINEYVLSNPLDSSRNSNIALNDSSSNCINKRDGSQDLDTGFNCDAEGSFSQAKSTETITNDKSSVNYHTSGQEPYDHQPQGVKVKTEEGGEGSEPSIKREPGLPALGVACAGPGTSANDKPLTKDNPENSTEESTQECVVKLEVEIEPDPLWIKKEVEDVEEWGWDDESESQAGKSGVPGTEPLRTPDATSLRVSGDIPQPFSTKEVFRGERAPTPYSERLQRISSNEQPTASQTHSTTAKTTLPYSKPFKTTADLLTHKQTDHTKVPRACCICYQQFRYKSQLLVHLRTHTKEKPLMCDVCNKEFPDKKNLNRHQYIHTRTRLFQCDVCHKQFSQKPNLAKHQLIHSNIKPFECDICNKKFKQSSHLTYHMYVHTDAKPHVCDICNKPFAHERYLYKHKLVHTDEKLFVCDICNKQFKCKSNLTRHKYIHLKGKTFECRICSAKFPGRQLLTEHQSTHSEEKPYTCDVCSKQFRELQLLNKHKRIHTDETPYACNICGKLFKRKSYLIDHTRVHLSDKPHTCGVCCKQFSRKSQLIEHEYVHTGVKPYACDICSKKFTRKSYLIQHIRNHTGEKS